MANSGSVGTGWWCGVPGVWGYGGVVRTLVVTRGTGPGPAFGRILGVFPCIWPILAIFGCISLYLANFGPVWPSFSSIWPYLALFGLVLAVFGPVWLYLALLASQRGPGGGCQRVPGGGCQRGPGGGVRGPGGAGLGLVSGGWHGQWNCVHCVCGVVNQNKWQNV